ncbi:hypothetical protein BRADI_4g30276v3 [Brachypodium distachyon]|uniref:Uncharacterized protein n=1 Tax=Brachypodium distachyon TaxID=15368 RepID=A0A2K2CRB1_BRADI|nr:hypothetical protein BRADI_4g30276v3 [Brachypodium distachyon]
MAGRRTMGGGGGRICCATGGGRPLSSCHGRRQAPRGSRLPAHFLAWGGGGGDGGGRRGRRRRSWQSSRDVGICSGGDGRTRWPAQVGASEAEVNDDAIRG